MITLSLLSGAKLFLGKTFLRDSLTLKLPWVTKIEFLMNMKAIFAVTSSTWAVEKIRPEKTDACMGWFSYIYSHRISTLYTLTSECIFFILFFIHFLSCWWGEFVQQSRAPLVDDHFLYSCDLNVWFKGVNVGRNWILVTLRGLRVKISIQYQADNWWE